MVDTEVNNTLKTLGVPVARLFYKGKAGAFITFQLVLGARSVFADDECEGKEYIYRADIFSKKDYSELLEKTVAALERLGCYEITIDPEDYENDTGYYHVPVTFKILEV